MNIYNSSQICGALTLQVTMYGLESRSHSTSACLPQRWSSQNRCPAHRPAPMPCLNPTIIPEVSFFSKTQLVMKTIETVSNDFTLFIMIQKASGKKLSFLDGWVILLRIFLFHSEGGALT